MGTIYSGVGLISGLDYENIIAQLIAIEARPRDLLLSRISNIDAQRTAYLDISARVSAILSRVNSLARRSFFTACNVSSSNSAVLTATAGEEPVPGSYSFVVRALATTHQLVSRGFASSDAQLSPGTLTIESARARVNAATYLDQLNGHAGVQRGSFQIVDAAGNQATISLHDALTLADVVARINAAEVNVRAEVRGDGLVLTETSGGPLEVREVDNGHVAADLGFGPGRRSAPGGRLVGGPLVYLADRTPLGALRDGNGIRRATTGGDFSINGITVDLGELIKPETRLERLNHGSGVELGRIRVTTTDAAGREQQFEIDLGGLSDIGQVKNAIESAAEGLTVTLADNRLVVGYSDASTERLLRIEDLSGHAARDLGIAGESESGTIRGGEILHVDTVGDVINAINFAAGNDGSVSAHLDGTRIVIEAGPTVELTALNGSAALRDLGFAEGTHEGPVLGGRIISGIDSALLSTLNGGRGFEPGRISIQAGDSNVVLDLSTAQTLRDVIELINDASEAEELGIEAAFDASGTRLVVRSRDGLTPIAISDVPGSGTFAADTGLAQDTPSPELRSNNLQLQYVSEATRLTELNGGRGVTLGQIRITNSLGQIRDFDLTEGQVETLADVIELINAAEDFGVRARINDTGDGLLLEDTAGGTLGLTVEDLSGSAARDLNLAGTAADGRLDGSYELRIEIAGSDTLADVVSRINEQNGIARAGILNDGTGITPYRLQLTATASGAAGELLVDGWEFSTLSAARDAQVVLGTDASGGVVITSSTNTLTDVVPGLTLELGAVSDEPVTVTVSRDLEGVVETLQGLVSSFNSAMEKIAEVGGYDAETETAGILLGEGTLRTVERRLYGLVNRYYSSDSGDLHRPVDVGIRIRDGQLQLDEERFRELLENQLEDVIAFFTTEETGLAEFMRTELESITDDGGLIDRRDQALDRQRELLNDRVEELNERLELKRERLMRQFMNLETVLSRLQAQQSVLDQLASLAGSFGTGL